MDICFGLHQIFILCLPPLCQNASCPPSPQKWLPLQSSHRWNVLLFTFRIPYLPFPFLLISLPDQLLAPSVLLPQVSCPPGAIAPLRWSPASVLGVHIASPREGASLFPCPWLPPAVMRNLCWCSCFSLLAGSLLCSEQREDWRLSLVLLNSTRCSHMPWPIPRCSLQFVCCSRWRFLKGFAAHCGSQKRFVGSRAGIVIQVILTSKGVHDCGTKEKLT